MAIKPRTFCKKSPGEIELRRLQHDEESRGVAIDFTVPGIPDFFCESWSIEPDPDSMALVAYAATRTRALEKAGFVEVTRAQFARAVKQRAVLVPPDTEIFVSDGRVIRPIRVESPEAAKRTKELIRYLKQNPDGEIRFVDERKATVQWWRLSLETQSDVSVEYTRGRSAQSVRTSFHLDFHEATHVLDEEHTKYCLGQIEAMKKRGYQYVRAAAFKRAQAKRATQLSK